MCSLLIATGGFTPGSDILEGTYDYGLVALSVALAMLASYAALDVASRVNKAHGAWRAMWLAGGAIAMGIGIWSMHYIGMLAFSLPVPVLYHYPTVILSLVAAIAASAVAFWTVSRERLGTLSWISASLIMGAGIAIMHYVGMMAMRLPATMEYRWSLVALSILLAAAISFVALRLLFRTGHESKRPLPKLISAAVMGAAVPLMHYTGMWAVYFHAGKAAFSTKNTVHISRLGLAAIIIATVLLLALALATAFIDRLLDSQVARQEQFRGLAEAIPQIVWIAAPDGSVTYVNRKWCETTGMTEEEALGPNRIDMIHPDDRRLTTQKWQECLGSASDFEIEYRLKNAAHGYRWYLARAIPLRDASGTVRQWFGTITDIEEQKQNQQTLERLIQERTEELANINTRLQEEMREKDLVRRDFDKRNETSMQELTERSRRATLLAHMGQLLQSCMSREEAIAAAIGFAPKIFPHRRGAVMLLNAAGKLVEVAGSWNDCELPVQAFEPPGCWALRTGQLHFVLAGDTTAPCAHAGALSHTYVCVPILAQGQTMGVLHIQTTDDLPNLDDAEISFKTTFAGQLGLSISNIRLRDALHTQSIRDVLTGLYNRRYLEEALEREIRRAVRAEQSLGILMLDLDHFKKCNDTFGHDAGDAILRETAALLSRSIRAEDIVCRYGGEEFVIILPTADLSASRLRAERIRAKLRELTVLYNGQSLGMITVSVGVSALPGNGTATQELITAADAALYRAKREGRDRVVAATPPGAPVANVVAAG